MYFLLIFILVSVTNAYPQASTNIVGGNKVRIEDYPFQVALLLYGKLWCGGTIVSEDHVLTAAHCILFATSTLTVRAGSSRYDRGGTKHRVIFNATYGSAINTDVSVLRVDPPFVFDKTHQPIDLAYHGEVITPGTIGQVVGWGSTDQTFLSLDLRAVEIPFVELDICRKLYNNTVIGQIKDGVLCGGYLDGTPKDACQGDSGGPFITDGRQAGIVSIGRGCAQPGFPSIYTDVAFYNEWIMEQISL